MPVRFRQEVQAVLRWGGGELSALWLPPLLEVFLYPRSAIIEHEADGFMETEFYLPDTFPTQESAIEAAIQAGRQKIDAEFERGRAVGNR
jgi:hypothetical protein